MRTVKILLFAFFLLMSLAAIIGGSYLIAVVLKLQSSGVTTTAEFLGYEESLSTIDGQERSESGIIYHHYHRVYQFIADGDTVVAQSRSAGEETDLFPGDPVEIVYDPENPEETELKDKLTGSLVAGIVCLALGLLVLFLLFFIRKQLRQQIQPGGQ